MIYYKIGFTGHFTKQRQRQKTISRQLFIKLEQSQKATPCQYEIVTWRNDLIKMEATTQHKMLTQCWFNAGPIYSNCIQYRIAHFGVFTDCLLYYVALCFYGINNWLSQKLCIMFEIWQPRWDQRFRFELRIINTVKSAYHANELHTCGAELYIYLCLTLWALTMH